jgi:hypothetical protein
MNELHQAVSFCAVKPCDRVLLLEHCEWEDEISGPTP